MSAQMDASNFTVAPSEELEPWAEAMLEEQEQAPQAAAEQAQQDPAASEVVLFQVPALAAGDAQGLADLIVAHPDLYEQILDAAAGFVGNDTISRALDIVHGAPGQASEVAEAAPEPAPEATPPAVIEQQAAEATTAGTEADVQAAEPAPVPQEEAKAEPGWAVRARAFNANHGDQVQLFNHATGYTCVGPDGEPDPNAVANWQAANGVAPDGRIGQETADRAWALMPVEAPKEQYTLPDDIPPPQ